MLQQATPTSYNSTMLSSYSAGSAALYAPLAAKHIWGNWLLSTHATLSVTHNCLDSVCIKLAVHGATVVEQLASLQCCHETLMSPDTTHQHWLMLLAPPDSPGSFYCFCFQEEGGRALQDLLSVGPTSSSSAGLMTASKQNKHCSFRRHLPGSRLVCLPLR